MDSRTDQLVALRELAVVDRPVDAIFERAVALAAAICGRPMAAISLSDLDRQWFMAEVGLGVREVPRKDAFCPHVLAMDGGGLEIVDTLADERFRENRLVTGEPNIRAYAGVPLVVADGVAVGTLCVLDSRPSRLTEEQGRGLRNLATLVGELLQMRRMAGVLAETITERDLARDREIATMTHMQVLFEGSPNGLILIDPDGQVKLANPAVARFLDRDQVDVVGRSFLELVAPGDRAAEAELLADLRASRHSTLVREAHLRRGDDTEQLVLLTSMQVRGAGNGDSKGDGGDDNAGDSEYFLIRAENIADRRQAEIELLESQSALDGIVTVDRHERIVSWNAGASRLLGHSRTAILGQHLSVIVPPHAHAAHAQGFARLAAGGEPVLLGKTIELEAMTADGALLPIELSLSRWYRDDKPFFTAVIRDITERRCHEAEQQWRSTHDAITGLGNLAALKQWFDDQPDLALERSRAVLSLQLTSFNDVTNALGAEVAEQLLRQIGAAFRDANRADIELCHLGDSHFAGGVYLESDPRESDPHPSNLSERLTAVARYVIEAATGPFTVAGIPVEMHAQIGVVATREADISFTELLRQAEAARTSTPRRINVADGLIAASGADSSQLLLLSELRAGIDRDELELHYQPVVQLQVHDRHRTGPDAPGAFVQRVEALVRWRHPTRGLVPPGDFIPLIETGPLISVLTRWVLNEALDQQSRWLTQGLDVTVAVNLSPQVLLNDDVVTLITSALDASGADPARLKVEITESAIVADPAEVRDIVRSLRRLGISVSIDDFGTGYTSLKLLRDLPVDEIKLDRLFVSNATTNPADAAIANSVALLAQRLGIKTVAEGVEDTETRSLVRALGYDFLQGYHESRPLPATEATAWLLAAAESFGSDLEAPADSTSAAVRLLI